MMLCLASASKESYDRAYPYLVRLHVLQEIEDVYEFNESSSKLRASRKEDAINLLLSEERLRLLSPAPQHMALCLAIRRSLYGILEQPQLVAQNWLAVSSEFRKFARFDAANLALRNAELWGLGESSLSAGGKNDTVLLQECLILKESGQVSKALELVESVEIEAATLQMQLESGNVSAEAKEMMARKFHIATQLMVSGKLKLGRAIADRYALLIQLQPQNEDVHYEYGRYLESLYHELRQRDGGDSSGAPSSTTPRPRTPVGALEDIRQQQQIQQQNENQSYRYAKQSIEMYCKCLSVGNLLTVQVMPRMLTLWFSFTALKDPFNNGADGGLTGRPTTATARPTPSPASLLSNAQNLVNESVYKLSAAIPAASWYTCTSQLVSRLGHSNQNTLNVIWQLLVRILTEFPDHAVWHIACLTKSLNPERCKMGQRFIEKAVMTLTKKKQNDEAAMLKESHTLFSDLVKLAEELPPGNEKRIRYPIGRSVNLSRFLVPTQSIMVNSPSRDIPSSRQCNLSSHIGSTHNLRIAEFNEVVDVAGSKARPKTLTLVTTSGTTVRFLSKQEKDGDLRKDSRLMEFNCVVNRLLAEDAEGRRRGLKLRTYAVVCLNEECGILEWVEHTRCIRHLIAESYKVSPETAYAPPNMREIMQQLPEMQTRHRVDIVSLTAEYQDKIASKYRPCFHRWFLNTFEDATCWLEARTRFSRSAAVWSVVGHIIGLGDRHTENILLDVRNGECVHVDFDCLFDKGLTLQKPEIVPFRLTPNMVDAMVSYSVIFA
jgi:serine/threonine-protein kinase ATR